MNNDKLKSEANPSLVVLRDNKPKWYLPESRREGYRNLHKINRYGLLYRSDLVLKLNKKYNKKIEDIPSVKKIIKHKYFCSLLVGKNQDILYEKYADDFTENTPQTIMSITKMFVNLFVGELIEKKIINLNKKISHYLPDIGSGYAAATIQDVLDMNIENAYSEDYTDPFTSSYLHEPVCGWRLPKNLNEKIGQEEFLNKIESNKNKEEVIKIVKVVNRTFNPMTSNKKITVSNEKPGCWEMFKKAWFSRSCKHKKKIMHGVMIMTSFLMV